MAKKSKKRSAMTRRDLLKNITVGTVASCASAAFL